MKYFLISLPLFASCAGLPPKPDGALCMIDVPMEELVCHSTKPMQKCSDLEKFDRLGGEQTVVPIQDAHNYICQSPDDWGKTVKYIQRLKLIIKRKCKRKGWF